ncbi:MAG: hypothetical protein ABIO16_06105 [Nocardioides sp.]
MTTWERRMEWPLTIAALVFLGTYAWPIWSRCENGLTGHWRSDER